MRLLCIALACALSAATVSAQPFALNEIYASHAGTDDQEFIEIVGAPGAPLDNLVVCIVEGDGAGAGTLDRAWDLTGNVMPADGYFVLGVAAVANVDLVVGNDNQIENGTETIYLIDAGSAANVAAIQAMLGTNIGTVFSGTAIATTPLPTMGALLDIVGMQDGAIGDINFDAAPVLGPDGTFFPAGIFRDGDFPGSWCQRFLDFDDVANAAEPRTPGALNTTCACSPFLGYNGNGLLGLEACPDAAGGLTVKVTGGEPNALLLIFVDVAIAPPGVTLPDGAQYVLPNFNPPIQLPVLTDPNGEYTMMIPAGPFGVFAQAGMANPNVAGGLDVSNAIQL